MNLELTGKTALVTARLEQTARRSEPARRGQSRRGEVRERFGRLDILIDNAGAIRGGDFLMIPTSSGRNRTPGYLTGGIANSGANPDAISLLDKRRNLAP